jgi:CutC family
MVRAVPHLQYATRALLLGILAKVVNLGNVVATLSPRGLCGFRSICGQVGPTILLAKSDRTELFDDTYRPYSAALGGADRLEVCGNLGIGGGTTPSLGLVRAIQKALPYLPIMVGSIITTLIRIRIPNLLLL